MNTMRRACLSVSIGLALLMVVPVGIVVAVPQSAFAATGGGGGGGLEWESGLSIFTDSIKGPVAYAVCLLGIIVCGATLIWGGELSEFVRRFMALILVIAIVGLGAKMLQDLFPSIQASGALVIP